MRSPIPIIIALSMAPFSPAAPTATVDLAPLNQPPSNLTTTAESADTPTCPSSSSCGIVNFTSGQYVSFGQGVCMQLGKNVQSIYVAHCYCTLWNSCTGNSNKDVYVGGMMMCEKPKTMDEFGLVVKYISCGGMN